jgi:hypothetical protein
VDQTLMQKCVGQDRPRPRQEKAGNESAPSSCLIIETRDEQTCDEDGYVGKNDTTDPRRQHTKCWRLA